jgi:hypothetical protein
MRMCKFVEFFTFVMSLFLVFDSVRCMQDGDVEMGGGQVESVTGADAAGSSAAPAAAAEPARLTGENKTDSPGFVVNLGKQKFNTYRLAEYYHAETKTLDLSHIPMGDIGLKGIFEHIRHFIAENDTEILLLESMGLVEVPYYLITFALVDKHLRVVSFQHNKFKIPGLPVLDEGPTPRSSYPSPRSRDRGESKRASTPVPYISQSGQDGGSSRVVGASAVANVITALWENFSPEIERELAEQSLGAEVVPLFKKIIFIDKRIPPITVFDQTQAVVATPVSKCQRFKAVVERTLFIIAGSIIGFLPQIIALCSSGGDTCDKDMLEKLIVACNSTRAASGDLVEADSDMLQKSSPDCNASASPGALGV